jgi:hypothetical protein
MPCHLEICIEACFKHKELNFPSSENASMNPSKLGMLVENKKLQSMDSSKVWK